MANSESYVLEGKSETVVEKEELQSDENAIIQQVKSDGVNVDQISNEANITHMDKCLSKKQMRKLKKEQEKLSHRKDRRARERMRKKMKRAAEREAGYVKSKRARISRMENSNCKQRVAIDMQFESLMRPKDIRHLFVQLSHAYAVNRRAKNPLQFSVVGFSGPQNKLFFDNPNNHHWDVIFEEKPLDVIFEKNDIVYLTADSENSLQTLDSSKVYVIGGLLDHNSLKGHCLKLAIEKGYAHARLPIAEYIMLQTRKVLTVNQVFEILLRYTENQSWKKSFFDVIPRRKGIIDSSKCQRNMKNNDNIERQKDDTTENANDILAGTINDQTMEDISSELMNGNN
uniref:tRNA (guanine(9)-N(1))-methyltransferase n=2 Tax=Wuchereria bancrofti TaxID=6293 RepID=A0A1I8ETN2_WUCBA